MKLRQAPLLSILALAFMPGIASADEASPWAGFNVGVGAAHGFNGKPTTNVQNPIPFKWELRGEQAVATAGYNWQFNNIVLGLEADYNYGSTTTQSTIVDGPFTYNSDLAVKNYYSLRAKFGFTPTKNTLLFVSGGPVQARLSANVNFVAPLVFGTSTPFQSVNASSNQSGVIYGFGAEYAFQEKTSVRLEYSEMKFEKFNFIQRIPFSPNTNIRSKTTQPVIRATLNYHF